MAKNISKLQKKIMRRIYYAYAIRTVTLPGVPQGFLMLGALISLTYFVSLGNVLQNLMQAPVGHLGVFFYNAVTNTEAWTLLILGVLIFSVLSFRLKIKAPEVGLFAKV